MKIAYVDLRQLCITTMEHLPKNKKRRLRHAEIQDIINSIPVVGPHHFKESSHDVVTARLRAQLDTVEIYPEVFAEFKRRIVREYNLSLITAGENVGILTAQSIGERQTQMTLNSIAYEETIGYMDVWTRQYVTEPIGQFIDKYMDKHASSVSTIQPNSTDYVDVPVDRYWILSVTPLGHVTWKPILALTRHDVPDNSSVVCVTTRTGKCVTASLRKSFITRKNNQLQQNTVGDLRVGDLIPIVQHSPSFHIPWFRPCSYAYGFVMAQFLGNTTTKCDETGVTFSNVAAADIVHFTHVAEQLDCGIVVHGQSVTLAASISVPDDIWTLSRECMRGYLNGIFGNKHTRDLPQRSLVMEIAEMLTRFGIVSNCTCTSVHIVNTDDYNDVIVENRPRLHYCLDDSIPGMDTHLFTGTVPRKTLAKHLDQTIMVRHDHDRETLRDAVSQTVYYDEIVSIQYVTAYKNKLYDFSVKDTKTFATMGGMLVYDTFHSTGLTVKTVVTGVPRFLELMNTTKEPKVASCTITMSKADYPTFSRIYDVREYIGDSLRCVTLHDILVDYDVMAWEDACQEGWWLADLKWTDETHPLPTVILRLRLDPKRIYEYRCSLFRIVQHLNTVLVDIFTVCSSLTECVIDFINLREDSVSLPLEKKSLAYVTEENKLHVFWEDIVIPRLRKLTVSGVDRIRDLVIVASKPFEEWEITTTGSNFKGILEMGKFDFRMLKTNNMWEIYNVLGIEATREFLVREFTSVISSDGTYINPCHVLLLVDTMTRNGDITSISRYSLRTKPSVLSRTSFEESIENFLRAGMFGEIDEIVSISSNIMTGKLSRIGTGICDILMTGDVFQEVDAVNTSIVKPPYNIELADQTQPAYNIIDILPKMFDRHD